MEDPYRSCGRGILLRDFTLILVDDSLVYVA